MTVTILNKKWEIIEATLTEISNVAVTEKRWNTGVCDCSQKRIMILKDLSDEAKQEVLIHEIVHAIQYETSLKEHLTDGAQEQYCEFVKFAYPIISEVLAQSASEVK